MSKKLAIGTRLRERRVDQGLRQADVASKAGISPSYLNLIEHNKRRISGKLLLQLAEVLGVDAAVLTGGADASVLDGMHAAAMRIGGLEEEVNRADDLARRFPGWAHLIAQQEVRLDALEVESRAHRDRMAYDPALAAALHKLITAVTSIRSTASILVTDDRIDADWQRRFHKNLDDDSRKLAGESEALIGYLDEASEVTRAQETLTGYDAAELFLAESGLLALAANTVDATELVAAFADADTTSLAPDVRELAQRQFAQICEDAAAMPRKRVMQMAVARDVDPSSLVAHFDVSLPAAMRRLACLSGQDGLPPMGLAVCDAAGVFTQIRPIAGFGLHRRASPCPLWPLFAALGQPTRPIAVDVVLPDVSETRFRCFAVAEPRGPANFHAAPVLESTMLVIADPPSSETLPLAVGNSCRICAHRDCHARREPSILHAKVAQ